MGKVSTVKELFVIRHAKSAWGDAGLDDHERPLNQRGQRDAPRMGAALAERGVRPDVIVSSTAVRAITTARLIAKEIGFPEESILQREALYLPRPDEVLQVLRELDESLASAMVFGHNPGFHETAWQMARRADRAPLDQFPTCSVAWFKLPIEFWGEIDFGVGELVEFLYPKGL